MDELNDTAAVAATATTSGATGASVGGVERSVGDRIRLEGVDIVTPTGVCLASKVDLEVPPMESVMVTGPNSTGKTSLFRVLSGLWRPGSGKIMTPVGRMQLVPQRVYSVTGRRTAPRLPVCFAPPCPGVGVPPRRRWSGLTPLLFFPFSLTPIAAAGSLADQVTYPQYIPKEARTADVEARMLRALEEVGVSFLATDRYDWDTTKPWEDTLSLGEQQRIGLARLLYHKPAFAVLDECTDAVSADAEKALFESLYASKITCECNWAYADDQGLLQQACARGCIAAGPPSRCWPPFKPIIDRVCVCPLASLVCHAAVVLELARVLAVPTDRQLTITSANSADTLLLLCWRVCQPATSRPLPTCTGITISKRLALEEFHAKNLALGVVSEEGWTEEAVAGPGEEAVAGPIEEAVAGPGEEGAPATAAGPPTEQPSNPIR